MTEVHLLRNIGKQPTPQALLLFRMKFKMGFEYFHTSIEGETILRLFCRKLVGKNRNSPDFQLLLARMFLRFMKRKFNLRIFGDERIFYNHLLEGNAYHIRVLLAILRKSMCLDRL